MKTSILLSLSLVLLPTTLIIIIIGLYVSFKTLINYIDRIALEIETEVNTALKDIVII